MRRYTPVIRWVLMGMMALAIAACGDQRERDLKLAVGAVRGTLESAGRNPFAAASLHEALEGGSIMRYLAANMNASTIKDFGLETGKPTRPWTIVVVAGDGGHFIVQGYGKDISKPLVSESVRVAAPGK